MPANIAFASGNGYRINHYRFEVPINIFHRTSPMASPRPVLVGSVYRTDTTRSSDLVIRPSPLLNLLNARAFA
jgi:hypothetical protein